MKGIVITTSGNISIQDFGSPIHETVGAIVGGYIEVVRPALLKEPYCMIANEDGYGMNLPINPIGSYLYGTGYHGAPILGDVVIMQLGYTSEGPDIVGIPDDTIGTVLDDFKSKFNLKED